MKYRPRGDIKKNKKLTINVTPEEHRLIKLIATEKDMTMTKFIIKSIKFYTNQNIKE